MLGLTSRYHLSTFLSRMRLETCGSANDASDVHKSHTVHECRIFSFENGNSLT